MKTYRINIKGQVQGVGFRPTLYRLAKRLKLKGWIANSADGAVLEVSCSPAEIGDFIKKTVKSLPANARIDTIKKTLVKSKVFNHFHIKDSLTGKEVSAKIPPDLSICPQCTKELFSKGDRRYLYPFINCTNCGPRFSIVKSLPYDRPLTTMSAFKMCVVCRTEYNNPADRRFHAQPDACPVCGPQVCLVSNSFKPIAQKQKAIEMTIGFLKAGKIVAIKSLGGYHLACDASNKNAITELRTRKNRPYKPFALMMPSIEAIKRICVINKNEEKLLLSPARPIVLLKKKPAGKRGASVVSDLITPDNASPPASFARRARHAYLGVMLPYTPLHYMLFKGSLNAPNALIMTSGNQRDEPICVTEDQVKTKLKDIADYFLVHNRPIHNRCDDSVIKTMPDGSPIFIRKSRGYVPEPIGLKGNGRPATSAGKLVHRGQKDWPCILSTGAELKNTFCITRGSEAYVSQHIGDMDNKEALDFYKEAIGRFSKFLQVKPKIVAHDLHPDYLSTIFAKNMLQQNPGIKTIGIQHHHAHIASALAEKGFDKPAIGFAFDGTGYGLDGNVWGGECFLNFGDRTLNNFGDRTLNSVELSVLSPKLLSVLSPKLFKRIAHFEYFPLPGGDIATKEIWRLAVSMMGQAGIKELPKYIKARYPHKEILNMIDKGINSPLCCSVGRIFDAVACILGLRHIVTFEAQAAMQLECASLDKYVKKGYNFNIIMPTKDKQVPTTIETGQARASWHDRPVVIRTSDIIRQIWKDKKSGVDIKIIGAKFHLTLAEIIEALSTYFGDKYKIKDIVLSGGVFQNGLLLKLAKQKLESQGFCVHYNRLVPPNDGGISLGQAWIAQKIVVSS